MPTSMSGYIATIIWNLERRSSHYGISNEQTDGQTDALRKKRNLTSNPASYIAVKTLKRPPHIPSIDRSYITPQIAERP
jgi:hypothetical protein